MAKHTHSTDQPDKDLPGSGSTLAPVVKRGGNQPLSSFIEALELPTGFSDRTGGDEDPNYQAAVRWLDNERVPGQNFWPALCLAYIYQAEMVLHAAGKDSVDDPFKTFNVAERHASGRAVNTLNFIVAGQTFHSRPPYARAAEVIRVRMRREHPSSAPHATQSWRDYRRLITLIFAMTPAGRARFAEYVWLKGVIEKPEVAWISSHAARVVRPFERVLADFDTTGADRGGALLQALVYGFFSADTSTLTLESHNVNTGSSRASMPGDVAGFRGGEVELAVEVKDMAITQASVEEVLVDFLADLTEAPNATAIVVAADVDQPSRDRLAESNVIALSRNELRLRVMTWDLPKQQEALRGALYFLARIQKKASLHDRLANFLKDQNIEVGIIEQPVLVVNSEIPVDNQSPG